MLAKLEAQYIQAFLAYKSADGTPGVTGTTAGVTFKNGLYVGGTFSAAALPITTDNITISGSAGNGYIQYGAQTVAPSLALVHTYADAGGHFAIGQSGSSGKTIVFTNGLMTADRDYAFQNKSGTLAMTNDNLSQFTNDTGFVAGPGSAVSGRLPSFNGTTGKLIQDSGINLAGTSGKTLTLTGSLTIGADTSITGGGTIALGGFTLTVPATGTLVLTSRTISAGVGLSGGGDLSSDRTLSMPNVGTSGLKTFATGDLLTTDSQGRVTDVTTATRTITEGAGLAGNTYDLSSNRTLAMGTPGTLSIISANAVSGTTHSHVITSSSNPGSAAALLSTDSFGFLTLRRLTLSDYLFVNAATANLYLKDTSTGLQVSATGIINPQSGNMFRNTAYTSGLVGWYISDPGNAEFNNVDIRGALHASVIVYGQVTATAGTILTSKSAAKLRTDVTIPSSPTYGTTTVNVDAVDADGLTHASSQLFVVNEILYLKDGLVGATWLKVSSVSDQTTFWRYVCTIQAGTNNVTYRAGLGVADYGGSGSGFIVQTADATNAPYIQMATHAATFTSANSSGTLIVTPRIRIGNLNGWGPYASDIYGLAAGDYAGGNWFATDPTNGLRVSAGGGDVHLDATGLSFVTPTSSKTSASLNWVSGTDITGSLYHSSDTSIAVAGITVVVPAANTAADSKIAFLAANSNSDIASFTMFQRANPAPAFFEIGGTNFIGGKIGATTAFAPTHMLEVYGTGWFQSSLALRDTSAAFDVTISVTSSTALTAARTLTIDVGNTSPTLSFGAWTTYTPTVTTTSGTITTLGTVTGRYKTIGKTVYIQVSVSITTNGTGAGAVDITLPVNARGSAAYILNGKETNAVGFACTAAIQTSDSTKLRMAKYDTTYPGSNGAILVVTGVYESA